MAKNNGKNKNPIAKNNKRMKNNYFTSMVDRFGEDFLNTMDQGSLLNSIQRDSGRIFREILGGNIDMGACAKYFAHPTLLNNLINISYNNYSISDYEFFVFQYYISCQEANGIVVDEQIIRLREQWRLRKEIYSMINVALNNFRVDPNPGYLIALCNQLKGYSNQRYLIM